jgi:hypothetical protein
MQPFGLPEEAGRARFWSVRCCTAVISGYDPEQSLHVRDWAEANFAWVEQRPHATLPRAREGGTPDF